MSKIEQNKTPEVKEVVKEVTPKATPKATPYEMFISVQEKIKVGKGRFNSFARFHFRSVEDIYLASKNLKVPLSLVLTDAVIEIAGRIFIEATATVKDLKGDVVETSKAQAELGAGKAGMSTEQATGSASSYARKYALNGLFLLDDNKDPDDVSVKSKVKGSTAPVTASAALAAKRKMLQDLIRGDAVKTKKATAALAGRNLLKLSDGELDDVIKAAKS